jgi:allantoate deiminase
VPRQEVKVNHRVIARCQELARFTQTPGETTRTFLCGAMHDCHRLLAAWMAELGMETTVDAAGNLRGLYAGSDAAAGRILIGSHLDTVPNAGAYDGVLGVVLAIALIESLESLGGHRFPFAIEVAGFSEEEGVRFGVPFIGSRALIGTLDDKLLSVEDEGGTSVRAAIRQFGLDPARLPEAALDPRTFAYLEFHIEQGPVLESMNEPLGVVESIVGQSRLACHFHGAAAHAGTTPMNLRRDALAGAAEWIGKVEQHARTVPGLVATVGRLEVKPGAGNVVPAEAIATLDVRHRSDEVRTRAVDDFIETAKDVARERAVGFEFDRRLDQNAVEMNPALIAAAAQALRQAGCRVHSMTSGAGHDAMILADKVPSVMIFLRSPRGLSHHPEETVYPEDVELALTAGLHLCTILA